LPQFDCKYIKHLLLYLDLPEEFDLSEEFVLLEEPDLLLPEAPELCLELLEETVAGAD
jgi:hypothetical protein